MSVGGLKGADESEEDGVGDDERGGEERHQHHHHQGGTLGLAKGGLGLARRQIEGLPVPDPTGNLPPHKRAMRIVGAAHPIPPFPWPLRNSLRMAPSRLLLGARRWASHWCRMRSLTAFWLRRLVLAWCSISRPVPHIMTAPLSSAHHERLRSSLPARRRRAPGLDRSCPWASLAWGGPPHARASLSLDVPGPRQGRLRSHHGVQPPEATEMNHDNLLDGAIIQRFRHEAQRPRATIRRQAMAGQKDA